MSIDLNYTSENYKESRELDAKISELIFGSPVVLWWPCTDPGGYNEHFLMDRTEVEEDGVTPKKREDFSGNLVTPDFTLEPIEKFSRDWSNEPEYNRCPPEQYILGEDPRNFYVIPRYLDSGSLFKKAEEKIFQMGLISDYYEFSQRKFRISFWKEYDELDYNNIYKFNQLSYKDRYKAMIYIIGAEKVWKNGKTT